MAMIMNVCMLCTAYDFISVCVFVSAIERAITAHSTWIVYNYFASAVRSLTSVHMCVPTSVWGVPSNFHAIVVYIWAKHKEFRMTM